MENVIKKNEIAKDELSKIKGFEANYYIRILTRDEVAKLLRIHPSTVTRYSKSGELKSFKLGSRRLFRYSDLLSFFDNQVDLQCISVKEV